MCVVHAIAWNTFLEALRDKILYLLVVFGVFVFGLSRLLSPLALGEGRRITVDMGLASISLFGCLITIFVGHQLIFREVERKTLYFIFSRPVHRWQFVCGKFLGLFLTLGVCLLSMGTLLTGVLLLSGYEFGGALGQAFLLKAGELLIMAASAVMVAAFTTPVLAGLLTLAVYVVGHGSGELFALLARTESVVVGALVKGISWVVPRLDLFHGTAPVLQNSSWPASHLVWALGYAGLYAAACLVFASLILSRREFHL